uniref:peptidase inhibitor family I36 protein n=1 Tax=Methylobacterium sp. B34 TaxID=95563 RepID=UPI001FCC1DA7|nr:peptidase inhibitor family I36 protein [Methylobacterium sp. B34]
MGAVVLADPGDGARSGSWRRFALPTLLVLGWVGLFAYSAAYLTEDLPFRPSPPEASPSAARSAAPRPARRVVMLDEPDPLTAPAEPPGQTAMAASPAPAVPHSAAAPPATTANARPAPGAAPAAAVPAAEYVGVWGPTPKACGVRSRRRGLHPGHDHAGPAPARAARCACSTTCGEAAAPGSRPPSAAIAAATGRRRSACRWMAST